jgi:hypothetical protein
MKLMTLYISYNIIQIPSLIMLASLFISLTSVSFCVKIQSNLKNNENTKNMNTNGKENTLCPCALSIPECCTPEFDTVSF